MIKYDIYIWDVRSWDAMGVTPREASEKGVGTGETSQRGGPQALGSGLPGANVH